MTNENTIKNSVMTQKFWEYAKKPILFCILAITSVLVAIIWFPMIIALPLCIAAGLVAWLSYQDIQEIKYGTKEPSHLNKWKAEIGNLKQKAETLRQATKDTSVVEDLEEATSSLSSTIQQLKKDVELLKDEIETLSLNLKGLEKTNNGVVLGNGGTTSPRKNIIKPEDTEDNNEDSNTTEEGEK